MIKKMWGWTKKVFGDKNAVSVFLVLTILFFTVTVGAIGILWCVILGQHLGDQLVNVMCAAAYGGIILGLFGGIIFLQRNEEPIL